VLWFISTKAASY